MDDAINIRGLKRVAADFAGEVDPPGMRAFYRKENRGSGGGPWTKCCLLSTAYGTSDHSI